MELLVRRDARRAAERCARHQSRVTPVSRSWPSAQSTRRPATVCLSTAFWKAPFFWGECHSALSEEWLYIQWPDQATCMRACVPSRTGCRSSSSVTPWMPPVRTGTRARAEEAVFDCACFSHVPGVIWQCFPEILDNPSIGELVMKTKI